MLKKIATLTLAAFLFTLPVTAVTMADEPGPGPQIKQEQNIGHEGHDKKDKFEKKDKKDKKEKFDKKDKKDKKDEIKAPNGAGPR